MTAAIERAADALHEVNCRIEDDCDARHPDWQRDARIALAAALDVREIERAIHATECGCAYDGEHTHADIYRREDLAHAIRDALLDQEPGR